jgi:hypothetical protein
MSCIPSMSAWGARSIKPDQELSHMRRHIVVTTLASVAVLVMLGGAPVVAAEKTPDIPAAWEGKTYTAVRAKILAAGWKPDHRIASMESEKAVQKRYPELRYCAVDSPLCSLYFTTKSGSCLKVVTRGEAPDEYRVAAVTRECDDVAP